jgi:sialidase-1
MLALFLSVHAPLAAAQLPPLTTVFTPGEAGINCWRIPAIVDASPPGVTDVATYRSTSGGGGAAAAAPLQQVLLAFAEARIDSCSDDASKMMAMKRSSDGGATWGSPQFIVGDNVSRTSSVWNPEPVVDQSSGKVILAYLINRTNCLARPGHCAAFTIESTDAGTQSVPTWSVPRHLAPTLGKFANGVRPGPGRALQLDVGPRTGRLLWSGSYDQIDPKPENQRTVDIVWYTDDKGKSFKLSPARVMDGDESSMVQLANGSLLMSVRPAVTPRCKCRAVSRSDDFGVHWTPLMYVAELTSPRCQGSMARPRGQSAVFFSNPSSTTARHNMTVRRSDDGGATFPRALVIYPNASGYSCLTALSGAAELGLLFEHEHDGKAYGMLSFVRVPMTLRMKTDHVHAPRR